MLLHSSGKIAMSLIKHSAYIVFFEFSENQLAWEGFNAQYERGTVSKKI